MTNIQTAPIPNGRLDEIERAATEVLLALELSRETVLELVRGYRAHLHDAAEPPGGVMGAGLVTQQARQAFMREALLRSITAGGFERWRARSWHPRTIGYEQAKPEEWIRDLERDVNHAFELLIKKSEEKNG
jgi:hypothetical protein